VSYDAVIIGAGPNGLTAAVSLAQAGRRVVVVEAGDSIGGGTRTAELTLPGFHHDVCSAIHAFGAASPFLRSLPLAEHGLRWLTPTVQLAHPVIGQPAALVHTSLSRTADQFGRHGARYRRLLGPIVADWRNVIETALQPVVSVPRHPISLVRFGFRALPSAMMAGRFLGDDRAAALYAGNAAHSAQPLGHPLTSSFAAILLAGAHTDGWPVAERGSQAIADALASYLESLGGEIRTGCMIRRMSDLPEHRVALFDTDASQVAHIAGDALPANYRRRLRRFRRGSGVWKVDYALDGPVPWADPTCAPAGTVHVGGLMTEIANGEADVHRGRMPDRPFLLTAQQSVVDPTRAPDGKHTLWAYAHVPNGYDGDATDAIERQLERFAPGFRDRVLGRHVISPDWLQNYNPNCVGGDVAGGSHGGLQLFFRPTKSLRPYRTPNPSIWICSAASPPGAGVHGMCGHNAARAVLAGPLA